MANEEDTVVVGQDLVRIETGGAPLSNSEKPASSESKQSSPDEGAPPKEEVQAEKGPATPPASESKPSTPAAPEKKESAPTKPAPKPSASSSEGPATLGNREERRVCLVSAIVVSLGIS